MLPSLPPLSIPETGPYPFLFLFPKKKSKLLSLIPLITLCFLSTSSCNSKIVLVLLSAGEAYVVDLRKDHRARIELCETQEDDSEEGQSSSRQRQVIPPHPTPYPLLIRSFIHSFSSTYPTLHAVLHGYRGAMTVARFDPSGKHIFIGTSLGYILVFNSRTKTVRHAPLP